jgi:hypothetical protein
MREHQTIYAGITPRITRLPFTNIKKEPALQVPFYITANKQFLPEQNRTEQNRTEQNRTEQNRTEQNRTEQNRTEQRRRFTHRCHRSLTYPATCNLQPATCNLQPATCNLQPATCNLQSAICNLLSAIQTEPAP